MVETRIAFDGESYTRREFLEYYGDTGEARWDEAGIAAAWGEVETAIDGASNEPAAESQDNARARQLGAPLQEWSLVPLFLSLIHI